MSQSNLTQRSTSDIKIGRLLKKIEKLRQQRDYSRKQLHHYREVISTQPYLESRYKSYTDAQNERARVKDLEKRVKEQEQLIILLNRTINEKN